MTIGESESGESMADQQVRPRPGGRSARVQLAVYRAVGELVDAGGGNALTIPQIAERAGVNPTSVYRRWGTVDALLGEVAVFVLTREERIPDTGELFQDLTEWVAAIATDLGLPNRRAHLRAMVSARTGIVVQCACWEFRRHQIDEMVARARTRGEQVPTENQVLDHVIAPLYHRAVFGLPIDEDLATGFVADVMRMATPAPGTVTLPA